MCDPKTPETPPVPDTEYSFRVPCWVWLDVMAPDKATAVARLNAMGDEFDQPLPGRGPVARVLVEIPEGLQESDIRQFYSETEEIGGLYDTEYAPRGLPK
jgi:hypothetical protein